LFCFRFSRTVPQKTISEQADALKGPTIERSVGKPRLEAFSHKLIERKQTQSQASKPPDHDLRSFGKLHHIDGRDPLIVGDQDRIEAAIAVERDARKHLAAISRDHLLVAPVRQRVRALRERRAALLDQVLVQFDAQRRFRQRLRQVGRNTLLPERIARRAALHGLVQKVFVDAHTWIASSLAYHASAQNCGQSRVVNSDPQERPRRSKLDGVSDWLKSLIETGSDITMPGLADALKEEHGMVATSAMLSRHLIHRLGFT